jgi:hypothetical protein
MGYLRNEWEREYETGMPGMELICQGIRREKGRKERHMD